METSQTIKVAGHSQREKLSPRLSDPLYFTFKTTLIFLREQISQLKVQGKILDLGCGHKPYKSLFPSTCKYIGVDSYPHIEADIVSNSWELPVKSLTIDCVISTYVLEHVFELEATINEIYRVLRPGGYVIITVPHTYPLHEYPHDFWRFTPFSLRQLFSKFEVVELQTSNGFMPTVTTMFNIMLQILIRKRLVLYPLFWINNFVAVVLDKSVNHSRKDLQKKTAFVVKGYNTYPLNYFAVFQKPIDA